MILLGDPFPSAPTRQAAAVAEREPWTLLKTISCDRGVRLGATRMNNLRMIRTRPDSRHGHARGHGRI